MKKGFVFAIMALLPVYMSVVTSCSNDEKRLQPELKAGTEGDVHVAYDGGWCEFKYSVINPSDQYAVSVSVPDTVDWITNVDTEHEGVVAFYVSPNMLGAERTAELLLAYGPSTLTFNVVQDGAEGETSDQFSFVIDNLTSSSVSYTVIPVDSDRTYLSLVIGKGYMDGFESNDEFFKYIMDYLSTTASSLGMNLDSFLEKEVLYKGESSDFVFYDLEAETEYYMFAYGMTVMGETTTGISRKAFKTQTKAQSDCVVELSTDVSGNKVTVKASPSDPEQAYYINLMEADDFLKFYGGEWPGAAEMFMSDEIFLMRMRDGMTDEQIFEELANFGEKEVEFTELNAEKDYYAFACAIGEDCSVIGEVTVKDFTTGSIEQSDNIIEFEVDKLGVNYAEVSVYPSNLDPFVPLIEKAVIFKGMEDDAIIKSVLEEYGDNLSYLVRTGHGVMYRSDLEPETEYMVYAFGYDYGVPTTQLFTHTFTTLNEVDPSSLVFDFEIKDVTQRGATVTVYPEPENARYYWNLVEAGNSQEDVIGIINAEYEYYLGLGYVRDMVDYMSKLTTTGESSSTFKTLDSDTEYKPFAVGVYAETGELATEIYFGDIFRTEILVPADVHIDLNVDEYYDGDEVAEKYPALGDAAGYAVVPVSTEVSDGTANYYYHIFEGDCSDTDYLSDERIIDELYPRGVKNEPEYVFYAPWNTVITLMGVAEDAEGNFGPVTRIVLNFSKGGVSPVDGFNPYGVTATASRTVTEVPEVSETVRRIQPFGSID